VKRNLTIDLMRFFAALIVFFGHLFYGPDHVSTLDASFHFLDIFQSGAFAVLLFFTLSGIALRFQTDKFHASRFWLVARLIRLMPMYWVTFSIPVIFGLLLRVQFSYPLYGYPIAFLGLQSFFSDLAIPPGNPPLWSLSVELTMSMALLVLVRFSRKQLKFVLILFLVSLGLIWPNILIFYCMPFFYLGYILPDIKRLFVFQRFFTIIFLFICVSISIFLRDFLDISTGRQEYFFLLLQISLLGLFCLAIPKTKENLLTFVSKRSYALYATHFPVILMIEKVFFSDTITLGLLQFMVSLSCVVIITEITYRIIDVPSIAASQRYLERIFPTQY